MQQQINSDQQHLEILQRVEQLWGAKPDTMDGALLDALIDLVVEYEERCFPLPEEQK